jgi:catecholate siderophore receptor
MASRSIIEDTAPSRPAGPSRRVHQLLAGSAMAIALTGHAGLATAQSGEGGGLQLPTLSVEGAGQGGSTDYKVDQPGLQKLTEPLRDTPQTINVVPQQLMKDQGVTTLRDALRDVPGISLAAGEFGAQGDNLTIRGFTARNDIYLDGMRDFGSYYRDPFDLEEIEVLKGPSSILFGRGSTGGVINQVTKTPQLAPFINGSLSFGTDLTKRATADVNEPVPSLGQGAAFRVNMEVTNADVAGRDVTENTRIGFAPSLALGLGTRPNTTRPITACRGFTPACPARASGSRVPPRCRRTAITALPTAIFCAPMSTSFRPRSSMTSTRP